MTSVGAGLLLSGLYLPSAAEMWGQARGVKSYKTQEAYCQDNQISRRAFKMSALTVEASTPATTLGKTLDTGRPRAPLQPRRLRPKPVHRRRVQFPGIRGVFKD